MPWPYSLFIEINLILKMLQLIGTTHVSDQVERKFRFYIHSILSRKLFQSPPFDI